MDDGTEKSWLRNGIILVVAIAVLGGIAFGVKALMGKGSGGKPQLQTVAIVRPPPPPPPPKQEEKPPEPEIKKEEVKLPDPEPTPELKNDEPPPAQNLGLDADGTAGSDGFGLSANKGGRDITTIGGEGNGTGGNGNAYRLYAAMVQAHIQEQLLKRDKLRTVDYKAIVRLWFSDDGGIEKFELVGTTGDEEIDQALKVALAEIHSVKEPPPQDMPQPVKLRVTSRGAG